MDRTVFDLAAQPKEGLIVLTARRFSVILPNHFFHLAFNPLQRLNHTVR
jgi:hypothetical protein